MNRQEALDMINGVNEQEVSNIINRIYDSIGKCETCQWGIVEEIAGTNRYWCGIDDELVAPNFYCGNFEMNY